MPAGRPPKADSVKAKQGTLRPSRVNRNSPKFDIGKVPPPPDFLNKVAAAVWVDFADQLHSHGLLQKVDHTLLASYCIEWSLYLKYAQMEDEGHDYFETKNELGVVTSMQIHPYTILADRHLKKCLEISREFGFSPMARTRISIPKDVKAQESPMAGLLKKKAG